MSVLTSLTPQNFSNSLLLLQLDRFNAQKVQRVQKNISDTINNRVNSINQEAEKYRDLKKSLQKASDFIDGLVARGGNIDNLLDKMATVAWKANYGIDLSYPGYSNSFDSYLRRINIEAEDMGEHPNLLGSSSKVKFKYRYKVSGTSNTLSPSFVGSDYTIKESGDFIWRRDRELSQLRRFVDSTGEYTGTFTSIASDAIQLDAFDSADDSITFTTSYSNADSTQYSGTITRSGLKVLDGWLYGGLSTADGRTRAADDLHEAENILLSVIASFQSAQTSGHFYEDKADITLDGFNNLIEEKTAAGLLKMQTSAIDGFRLNSINTAIVSSAINTKSLYLEAISLGKAGNLTKALIDIMV